MLLGEFHCAIDSDGRLTIPSEFLAELTGGLTVTRGIERCLFVYPNEEWRRLARKMQTHFRLTNPDARAFARLMFSGAQTCVPDRQGRVVLPDHLRKYAGIDRSAVAIGLWSHLEIWSTQRWEEILARLSTQGPAVAERLSHLEV